MLLSIALYLSSAVLTAPYVAVEPFQVPTTQRPVRIASLSDNRFATGYALDGVHGLALRQQLTSPTNFSPGGIHAASFQITDFVTIPEDLDGFDIVFIGSVPTDAPNGLTPAERSALRRYWRQGGLLVILGDDIRVSSGDELLSRWWQTTEFAGGSNLNNWQTAFVANPDPGVYSVGAFPVFTYFNEPGFFGQATPNDFNGYDAFRISNGGTSYFSDTPGGIPVATLSGHGPLLATFESSGGKAFLASDRDWLFGSTIPNDGYDTATNIMLKNIFAYFSSSPLGLYVYGAEVVTAEQSPYLSVNAFLDSNRGAIIRGSFVVDVGDLDPFYIELRTESGNDGDCLRVANLFRCGEGLRFGGQYVTLNGMFRPAAPGVYKLKIGFVPDLPVPANYAEYMTREVTLTVASMPPPVVRMVQTAPFTPQLMSAPVDPPTDQAHFDLSITNVSDQRLFVTDNTITFLQADGRFASATYEALFENPTTVSNCSIPCILPGIYIAAHDTLRWKIAVTATTAGPAQVSHQFNFAYANESFTSARTIINFDVADTAGLKSPVINVGAFVPNFYNASYFTGDELYEVLGGRAGFLSSNEFARGGSVGVSVNYFEVLENGQPTLASFRNANVWLMSALLGGGSLSQSGVAVLDSWVKQGGVLILDGTSFFGTNGTMAGVFERFGIQFTSMGFGAEQFGLGAGAPASFSDGSILPAISTPGTINSYTVNDLTGYDSLIETTGLDPNVVLLGSRTFGKGKVYIVNSESIWLGTSDTTATSPAGSLINAKLMADLATPALRAVSTPRVPAALATAFTLPLAVENTGRVALTGVEVVVTLPDGLTFNSVLNTSEVTCVDSGSVPPPAIYNCTINASIAPGALGVIQMRVTPSAAGPFSITHVATVRTPPNENTTDNTGTTTVTLTQPIDLELSAANLPETIAPGQSFAVTLTAKNLSGSAVDNVSLAAVFSPNTVPLTAPAGCTVSGDRLICAIGTLAGNATRAFDVTIAVDASLGVRTFSAALVSGNFDPNPSNNTVIRAYGLGTPVVSPSEVSLSTFAPLAAAGCASTSADGISSAAMVLVALVLYRRRARSAV